MAPQSPISFSPLHCGPLGAGTSASRSCSPRVRCTARSLPPPRDRRAAFVILASLGSSEPGHDANALKLNALALYAIAAVLLAAFYLQFAWGELRAAVPGPVCRRRAARSGPSRWRPSGLVLAVTLASAAGMRFHLVPGHAAPLPAALLAELIAARLRTWRGQPRRQAWRASSPWQRSPARSSGRRRRR
jgi:hypothetical protein